MSSSATGRGPSPRGNEAGSAGNPRGVGPAAGTAVVECLYAILGGYFPVLRPPHSKKKIKNFSRIEKTMLDL